MTTKQPVREENEANDDSHRGADGADLAQWRGPWSIDVGFWHPDNP